jgi:hypothetical protein
MQKEIDRLLALLEADKQELDNWRNKYLDEQRKVQLLQMESLKMADSYSRLEISTN